MIWFVIAATYLTPCVTSEIIDSEEKSSEDMLDVSLLYLYVQHNQMNSHLNVCGSLLDTFF
jgi:hypothetical protein